MGAGADSTGQPSALVLAGRRGGDDPLLAAHPGLATKALLPVAGRPMVERVLEALDGFDVWISGLTAEEAPARHIAPPAASPASAVLAAAEAGAPLPLLVTTADHALLTRELVDAFVTQAKASGADLCVGLTRREAIEARFPGVSRTYLRFRGAEVSGCNLFYLANERGLEGVRFWRRAEADRKRPLRLARRIGPSVLVAYALKRLTLGGLFEHASRRLGANVAPILLADGAAAVDVDKPSDLALVEAVLRGEA
ncbi:NTP transferase domain-containing protein [Parvularcula dongshanensis]|uniref:GTP:adenosylcobinamide-phosphate guanylyltransferase n=1 Tax=Parvularcula dongshanensis TaxID=1173995 RepID=A0A840I4U0_9PROT|nr:GTP:adenosylcobinamide-phosphate guanylyltransferase [Parvularcula dongshanensis]